MTGESAKNSMKPLLIRGGHIIDPGQGIDEVGSLLITDGKIPWQGRGEITPPQPDYDVLPAQGQGNGYRITGQAGLSG